MFIEDGLYLGVDKPALPVLEGFKYLAGWFGLAQAYLLLVLRFGLGKKCTISVSWELSVILSTCMVRLYKH